MIIDSDAMPLFDEDAETLSDVFFDYDPGATARCSGVCVSTRVRARVPRLTLQGPQGVYGIGTLR